MILSLLLCTVSFALSAQEKTAYAVFSNDSLTMTFYYDTLKDVRAAKGLKAYELDLDFSNTLAPLWHEDTLFQTITKAVFDASFADALPKVTSRWFDGAIRLKQIEGAENINTSEVVYMSRMFADCASLDTLNIEHFVFNEYIFYGGMFSGCTGLRQLRLGSADIDIPRYGLNVFQGVGTAEKPCALLVRNDFNFEIFEADSLGNQTYDGGTFRIVRYGPEMKQPEHYAVFSPDRTRMTLYCDTLKDERSAEGLCFNLPEDGELAAYSMTQTDSVIAKVDTVFFDASFRRARPKSMDYWFYNAKSLKAFNNWNVNAEKVTSMRYTFANCAQLRKLPQIYTDNVTSMRGMFMGCESLRSFSFYLEGPFNTINVTDMSSMFDGCKSLKRVDPHLLITDNVTTMERMFRNCKSLKELDLSAINTDKVKFASNFLSGADSLRYLNLGGNDFYHAALMRDMFKDVGSAYDDAACRLYVNDSFRLDRLENAGAPYYNWGNGRFFTQVYEKTIQQDQKFKDGEATANVLVDRTFVADTWQTLALPFALSKAQIDSVYGAGTLVARMDSFSGDTLYFKHVESIEANIPVIIRPTVAVERPVFNGVDIKRDYTYGNYIIDMVGDEIRAELDGYLGGYLLLNRPACVFQDSPLAATTFTSPYVQYNTEATFLLYKMNGYGENEWKKYDYYQNVPIVISPASGETTRITMPAVVRPNTERMYNLAGQPVGKGYKGIVIRNGKKIVKKN